MSTVIEVILFHIAIFAISFVLIALIAIVLAYFIDFGDEDKG